MHCSMFLLPTWISDLFSGHGFCRSLMKAGVSIWNRLLSFIYVLMGQDIGDFANGQPVKIMESVNTIFVGVGTSLVVLFFLWGFFSDSVNIREDITLDKALKVFIRLLVSNYFVIHSLDILKIILNVGVRLNNKILSVNSGTFTKLDFAKFKFPKSSMSDRLVSWLLGGWIFLTILGFIFLVVMTVCALIIVYVVYIRVIKLCIYMPFGAVSFSTMSSQSPEFHNMAIGYFKNFLAMVFEICVISLAILICNGVVSAGFDDLTNAIINAIVDGGDDMLVYYKTTIGNAIGCMLMASLTVGTVKGASELARKVFS